MGVFRRKLFLYQ